MSECNKDVVKEADIKGVSLCVYSRLALPPRSQRSESWAGASKGSSLRRAQHLARRALCILRRVSRLVSVLDLCNRSDWRQWLIAQGG